MRKKKEVVVLEQERGGRWKYKAGVKPWSYVTKEDMKKYEWFSKWIGEDKVD